MPKLFSLLLVLKLFCDLRAVLITVITVLPHLLLLLTWMSSNEDSSHVTGDRLNVLFWPPCFEGNLRIAFRQVHLSHQRLRSYLFKSMF